MRRAIHSSHYCSSTFLDNCVEFSKQTDQKVEIYSVLNKNELVTTNINQVANSSCTQQRCHLRTCTFYCPLFF